MTYIKVCVSSLVCVGVAVHGLSLPNKFGLQPVTKPATPNSQNLTSIDNSAFNHSENSTISKKSDNSYFEKLRDIIDDDAFSDIHIAASCMS